MEPVIPEIIVAVGVVLIPSIALSARFALKPIVEAIIRLRDAFPMAVAAAPAQVEHRLAAVEEDLRQLREGFDRLSAAVEFEAQLRAGAGAAPRLPQA